jgi:hypothetical protein
VLLLMLLMPLGLLVMLRGLERYERRLDDPGPSERHPARAAAAQRVVTVEPVLPVIPTVGVQPVTVGEVEPA